MAILQGVTINNTIVGGLVYQGIYDASTNQPSLANAKQGDFYKISVAGVQFGEDFQIGDMLLINADMGGVIDNAKIDKVDNTEAIAELTDLSDVTINAPANGEVLQYNGTNFVNATIASGGATDLDGLSDVTITSVSNGDTLVYNSSTSVFENIEPHQNVTILGTTDTAKDASANEFILIPDGHTASSLLINLPNAPAVGSTVTVARGGNTTSSNIYVKCNNISGRIFVFDQLTPTGSRNDKVYIDAFTVVKFTLLSGSGASAIWYADFGLNTLFPVALTKSSTTDDYKLNVANGSILQFNTSAGATGIGAFEDVSTNSIAFISYSAITAGTTTAVANTHYSVNTSGGQVNINLPQLSTVTTGTEIRVKVRDATNNTIITGFNSGSETIDGAGTLILSVQYQSVTCVAGSTEWEVI